MTKVLLITGIIVILMILSIFAVSAVIIYSVDNPNQEVLQPSKSYDNDYYSHEKPVIINSDSNNKNTACYKGLYQEKGCNPYEEVPQKNIPCYKTIKLECGKEVKVSCDYSVPQVKGCNPYEEVPQEKTPCYKTIKLECGKEIKVSCDYSVPQERGYSCYGEVPQIKNDCIVSKEKGCK
jgi:hypothetical protein